MERHPTHTCLQRPRAILHTSCSFLQIKYLRKEINSHEKQVGTGSVNYFHSMEDGHTSSQAQREVLMTEMNQAGPFPDRRPCPAQLHSRGRGRDCRVLGRVPRGRTFELCFQRMRCENHRDQCLAQCVGTGRDSMFTATFKCRIQQR